MTGVAWRQYLQTYVALRRAIGFSRRASTCPASDNAEFS